MESLNEFKPLKKNLTVKDVAEFLGISEASVKNRIYSSELIAFKIGVLWRISRENLERYIENSKNITDLENSR